MARRGDRRSVGGDVALDAGVVERERSVADDAPFVELFEGGNGLGRGERVEARDVVAVELEVEDARVLSDPRLRPTTVSIYVSFSVTRSFSVRFGRSIVSTTRTCPVALQNTLHSPRLDARLDHSQTPTRILNRYCGWTLIRARLVDLGM